MKRQRSQRGIILFTALSALALLSLIVAGIIAVSRSDRLLARNAVELAKTKLAAQSAVSYALAGLIARDANAPWRIDGAPRMLEIAGAKVQISIQDDIGKVDVNAASEELLAALFQELGSPRAAAEKLSATIADWRDPDSLTRLNGGEAGEYRAAGLPYGPRNRSFESLGELALVLDGGATIDAARPYLTLHSQRAFVEPRYAAPPVKAAVEKSQDTTSTASASATTVELPDINGRAFTIAANAMLGGTNVATRVTVRMMRRPLRLETN